MSVATMGPAEALRGLLPRESVITGEEAEKWCACGGAPGAVVFPASTDEAGSILARASTEGWKVVPAGAGCWLWEGGPTPDLVISTSRMTKIVDYEPANLTITVEAGMTLASIAQLLTPKRQWLPLDPPGSTSTIGAVASTGIGGPLAATWGAPRDQALGLRAVTGDGRAFNAGGRVVKNVAGFDLVRLLCGSMGTLALLTEVTVRLYPLPEADRTLVVRANRLEELADAAVRARSHPITPAAVELFERHLPIERRSEALLAIRLVGGEERVAAEAEVFGQLIGAMPLAAAEAESFWREVRELDEGSELSLRVSLEPSRLGETIALAREVGRMRDGHDELAHAPLRIGAHAASGALRLAVPHIKVESGWDEQWAQRIDDLRRTLAWRGGTLTVTRGPAELLGLLPPAEATLQSELTAGLKAVFDPTGILSVDRFLLGVGGDTRG